MYDNYDLKERVQSFDTSPVSEAYLGVIIYTSEEDDSPYGYYGDISDSSRVLELTAPICASTVRATEIAENIYNSINGKQYVPFSAENADLPPIYGLGDSVTINDVTAIIAKQSLKLDSMNVSDISAPFEEDIDSEIEYVSQSDRKVKRQFSTQKADYTSKFEINAQAITAEVAAREESGTELKSMITQTTDEIQAEVTRAQGAEDELSASIKINAESITSCVTKGDVGSYITQYYDNVIIAFNDNSKYVQINAGNITIYNGDITTAKKRSMFDETGIHFYRENDTSNYYVGKIGTNNWAGDSNHKGLVFDLEYNGKYIAFAQRESSSADSYTTMLTFSRANSIYDEYGLHLGCALYRHNCEANGLNLTNSLADGYSTYTGALPVVLSITDNGDGTFTWTSGNVTIKNGLITSVPA